MLNAKLALEQIYPTEWNNIKTFLKIVLLCMKNDVMQHNDICHNHATNSLSHATTSRCIPSWLLATVAVLECI